MVVPDGESEQVRNDAAAERGSEGTQVAVPGGGGLRKLARKW